MSAKYYVIGIVAVLFASQALADRIVAVPNTQMNPAPLCDTVQESANLNVVFNISASSFADAKAKFDEQLKQVDSLAAETHPKQFKMQSMNYNIHDHHARNDESAEFQLRGSANYTVDSSDTALKLGELLSKQKFQVNVNANQYRSCPTNNFPVMGE